MIPTTEAPVIDDVWTIAQSYLDTRTWVPYNHEGDQSCFLHAGPLGRVKHWVQLQVGDMRDYRWVKGERAWYLVLR